MAPRRLRLCPINGTPSAPGGRFFAAEDENLVLNLWKRNMVMTRRIMGVIILQLVQISRERKKVMGIDFFRSSLFIGVVKGFLIFLNKWGMEILTRRVEEIVYINYC